MHERISEKTHLKHMNVLVFSHLRWNFVFQRPQQLMTRCAREHQVFFWEEPHYGARIPQLEIYHSDPNVTVIVPNLPANLSADHCCRLERQLLADMLADYHIDDRVLWYYTPLALQFSRGLDCEAVVYDCMDELSAFRGAPPGLRFAEAELFRKADLVFTGGKSLYESKKHQNPSVHCFPSSIDRKFFCTARDFHNDPEDQAPIPHPRLGFCGVIDERMDIDLLAGIAALRPDWHFIMLGPVVKIERSELPANTNIHYLGSKDYRSLPSYFANWDAGLLPFARNESTRFISPTKTPEYLAAGLPVVSTSITDVVDPYGRNGLVHIADSPERFVAEAEKALLSRNAPDRLAKVDGFLRNMSWDQTWDRMQSLILDVADRNRKVQPARFPALRESMAAD